jgi:hypothetical protein
MKQLSSAAWSLATPAKALVGSYTADADRQIYFSIRSAGTGDYAGYELQWRFSPTFVRVTETGKIRNGESTDGSVQAVTDGVNDGFNYSNQYILHTGDTLNIYGEELTEAASTSGGTLEFFGTETPDELAAAVLSRVRAGGSAGQNLDTMLGGVSWH